MRVKNVVSSILLCCFTLAGFAQNKQNCKMPIRFATESEAVKLLTDHDVFSDGLNAFDLNLRLRKPNSTKADWLKLVAHEDIAWTEEEKAKMKRSFTIIENHIEEMKLNIPFPDEIVLLKTSMREELDAGGYTRKNWIAVGQNVVTKANEKQLSVLLGHELFHVLSRHNADFKKAVYETIGFKTIGHEIKFPADAMAKRISNPDIARRDSYITLDIDGKKVCCSEFIYTTKPYTEGSIYDYIKVGFIPLDKHFKPIIKEGKTVIYPIQKVAEQFKEKIGTNTDYNIDPEEVSADHFSFLVTGKKGLPNPEIIEAIKVKLQKFKTEKN